MYSRMKHKIFIFHTWNIIWWQNIYNIWCLCCDTKIFIRMYIHKIWLRMKNMKIITNLSERVWAYSRNHGSKFFGNKYVQAWFDFSTPQKKVITVIHSCHWQSLIQLTDTPSPLISHLFSPFSFYCCFLRFNSQKSEFN